jgi:glycerol-3-phosphate cytidylyltransferase
MKENKIIGYTAGAFDLFHIGHLNLLRRAKDGCDHLIVGVTTDELIQKTKKKKPIVPFSERFEIISSIRYVDEVVVQDDLDKVLAWKRYRYDILFSGDDWKGNPRWIGYETELGKVGVRIVYFPYTKSTSSTAINQVLNKIYSEGIDENR